MKRFLICLSLSLSFSSFAHQFRDYENAPPHVKEFYRAQHTYQTYAFAKDQAEQFQAIMNEALLALDDELEAMEKSGKIKRMSLWQAILELDKLVDESDPDINLPNSVHAFQTAEAVRASLKDEKQDWMVLIGLLHDIGKVDALLRKSPQWAVVGDTFPVGCKFDEANVFVKYFERNPDAKNQVLNSVYGIYQPHIGLDNLTMSWGHDEYGYRVLSEQGFLPRPALSMLRFHSFYPLHQEGAYRHLLNPDIDEEQLKWIKVFNPYDLYSKSSNVLDKEKLKIYYQALINKYFPPKEGEKEKLLIWPVLKPIVETKDEL